jgi:dolichol-phosphate mannosyltransferase
VGGSGVAVDMGVLFVLSDPRCLGWNITFSKICAAQIAMLNNFVWNELWTFRRSPASPLSAEGDSEVVDHSPSRPGVLRRLLIFNAICGIGIVLAVLLLHLFHNLFGWNLYASNLLAIILVTLWNFTLSARWNWKDRKL